MKVSVKLFQEEESGVYETDGGNWAFKDKDGERHYFDDKPSAEAAAKGETSTSTDSEDPEQKRISNNEKFANDINDIMDNGYDYSDKIKSYTDKGVDIEHELKVFVKKRGFESADSLGKDDYGDFLFWLDDDYGKKGRRKSPRKPPSEGKISDDDKQKNKEIVDSYLDQYDKENTSVKNYLKNLDKENIDLQKELMDYAKNKKKELGQLSNKEKKAAIFDLAHKYSLDKKKSSSSTSSKPIETIKPNVDEEDGEIDRVSKELMGYGEDDTVPEKDNDLYVQKYEKLRSDIENSEPEELTDEIWDKLENTDSTDIKYGDENAAKKLAKKYGKNIDSVLSAIDKGEKLPAPIILRKEDGTYTLVGGNTRLMSMKAKGVRPKAIIVDWKKNPPEWVKNDQEPPAPKKEDPKQDEAPVAKKEEPVKTSSLPPEKVKGNKKTSILISQVLNPASAKVIDSMTEKGVDAKEELDNYAKVMEVDPEDMDEQDYKDFIHFMRIKHKIKKESRLTRYKRLFT